MALTTAGKDWLATNAGVGGCFSPTGVTFQDADGVSWTMGTKDVVTSFVGAHMAAKDDVIIVADTTYNGFKAINGGDVGYADVTYVYNNDGHGGTPQYCAPAANVISATLTVDTNACTELCTVNGNVSWTNNGNAPSAPMDLQVTVTGGTPTTVATGVVINPGETTPEYPFSISGLVVGTYDICASPNSGTTCQTIVVSPTPANVISATLTVDTNDCTEPCTVGGTVSWTNNGGTASVPIDLGITVNGTVTVLAPGVAIDPGATTTAYPFSLPDLAAGTYEICASPDSGTSCQTVTVRTPAAITTTNITLTPTACSEPCNVAVDVTYMNSGQTSGTFTPEITVDGTSVQLTPDTLGPGASVVKTFELTDKTIGTYTICAVPLGSTTCQTLVVSQVQEAGMGPLLVIGLAFGAILMAGKKEEKKKKGKTTIGF